MGASRKEHGKRHGSEQTTPKLREAEVALARELEVPGTCMKTGITEQTYCRWRKKHGGLQMDQAKRTKDLDRQNARPNTLLPDADLELVLDKAILREAASPNC